MVDLFMKYKVVLEQALKDDIVGVYAVGSGAIPGIPGSPMIDIAVASKNYPVTEEQMLKLKVLQQLPNIYTHACKIEKVSTTICDNINIKLILESQSWSDRRW